jgi:hypothetical protein
MGLVVLSTGQEPRETWLRASTGRSNERCWNIILNEQAAGTNGPFSALSWHNNMKGPEYFSKSGMIYLLFQNKYLFYCGHILHTHTHTHTHRVTPEHLNVTSPVRRQAPATTKICKYGFTVSRQLRDTEAGRRTIPRTREDKGQWNSHGGKGTVQCMGALVSIVFPLDETQGVEVMKVM